MAEEAGSANLEKVDHIVVLMMENRSFDHMLGYLSLEGGRSDVDGLRAGLANEHQGRSYPVHHLGTTVIAEDPDHSASSVDVQIGGGNMDGFVASYAATLQSSGMDDPTRRRSWVTTVARTSRSTIISPASSPSVIAGSARFRGRPGQTACMPCAVTRPAAAMAGPHNLPPLYNQPSFVRHLDAHSISWRWYSTDVGSLRMADQLYSLGHHDRFAYVTKTGLPWKAKLNWRVQGDVPSFLEDAAAGTLPSVSWIDPTFGNFNPLGLQQNDDHPPADITDGQDLVLAVYHAVATSPQWDRTLLVIFYDEHGGFFDHVPPPAAADDDPDMFGRYGVRVPALIVSPWVAPRSVSTHAVRSHIDHQDDPAAVLRHRPPTPRSPGELVHLAQSRPSALPGNTRRARQQLGRAPHQHHATTRASAPRADSGRQSPRGRTGTGRRR